MSKPITLDDLTDYLEFLEEHYKKSQNSELHKRIMHIADFISWLKRKKQ